MSSLRGFAALAVGVIAISWSAVFIRWAPMPGPASAFYRLLISSALLCPYVWFTRHRTALTRRTLLLAALGGIFFAGDLGLYSTAVLTGSAANATVLANNTPIIVGLIAWLVNRQRPSSAFWTGLIVAIAGSLVILGADLLRHAHFGAADLLAVASAACFAFYLLVTERLRADVDTAVVLALSLLASTVALLVFNLVTGISLQVPTRGSWLALLALALICQLLGYFSLTYALGHLSATVTSVSLLAQAPLTAGLAVLFLHESLSRAQVLGSALVLAGVWIVNRYSRRQMMLAD